jgi:hypothetical protein
MLFAVLKLSSEIFTPSPMRQRGEGQGGFCSYKNTTCRQIRPFQETGFIPTNQNPYPNKAFRTTTKRMALKAFLSRLRSFHISNNYAAIFHKNTL